MAKQFAKKEFREPLGNAQPVAADPACLDVALAAADAVAADAAAAAAAYLPQPWLFS